jgi:hypothetical protein
MVTLKKKKNNKANTPCQVSTERTTARLNSTTRKLLFPTPPSYPIPTQSQYILIFCRCAQVKITGGGTGFPSTDATIQFPGRYKQDDPSFNFSVWGGMKEYPMPGPPVWTGGTESGSGSGSAFNGTSADSSSTGETQEEEKHTCSRRRRRARHVRQ